jgi:group II intron reverse transcriptase/maturase
MAKGGRFSGSAGSVEVREMREAETILSIIQDRGSRGLPLERLYRHLFNPELYLLAYGKINSNRGAMTPGVTKETVDGMDLDKIQAIIEKLRKEQFRWSPAKRVYIEKKNSTRKRPLGMPTWSDKLLQEVIRLLLEAYYEPQFSDLSHGFRPNRGCHTALGKIHHTWNGTTWFIEGDISQCFDGLDHEVLLSILREKIHDGRFVGLIEGLLKAGYLEGWNYGRTLSGTPQGGVLSPLLSNIYLDRMDKFAEEFISNYNQGERRKKNPEYRSLAYSVRAAKDQGQNARVRELRKRMYSLPSLDPNDPNYRRLRYVRYADDFLLGLTGPKGEAETVKHLFGKFLREQLKLELSEEKTLITHGRTEKARFLGYDLSIGNNQKRTKHPDGISRRSVGQIVRLQVPREVVLEKCKPHLEDGKPIHRPERIRDSAFSIVHLYAAEYRGIVNYYRMAQNLHALSRLKWVMEASMVKTLAAKFKVSVPQIYRRYQTTIMTEQGPRKAVQVIVEREGREPLVATWGRTNLVRDVGAALDENKPNSWINGGSTEVVQRLLADTCELCGSREDVEVHHIRALKSIQKKGRREKPEWEQLMIARQRKTLVVCRDCHLKIHNGKMPQVVKHENWRAG